MCLTFSDTQQSQPSPARSTHSTHIHHHHHHHHHTTIPIAKPNGHISNEIKWEEGE